MLNWPASLKVNLGRLRLQSPQPSAPPSVPPVIVSMGLTLVDQMWTPSRELRIWMLLLTETQSE